MARDYQEEILAVLRQDIKPRERDLLTEAMVALMQGRYEPRVLADLEGQLRPLAIASQLSKPVSAFYLGLTGGQRELSLARGLLSWASYLGPRPF